MSFFEIPFTVSSDSEAGARNISADGSRFDVILDTALFIPPEADYAEMYATESTVWNVSPNITSNLNDTFYIRDQGVDRVVIIDEGLYDINSLNTAIDLGIQALGGTAGLLQLIPESATQKVIIQFNFLDTQINFILANNFRVVLGFNATLVPLVPTAPTVPQIEKAPNQAVFNNIDFFLIHTTLCDEGIRFNQTYAQILDKVNITVAPGNQIVQRNVLPLRCPCYQLIGGVRKSFRVWLTDQSNLPVDTEGEIFSISFVIRFRVPIFVIQQETELSLRN